MAARFGVRFPPLVVAAVAAWCLSTACGQPESAGTPKSAVPDQKAPAAAQPTAKAEHTFRGKVESVDPATKMLSVNGENVEGWMPAMTMSYTADKDDVFSTVKAGDQITATVYDGDFKTLHGVQVVSAGAK